MICFNSDMTDLCTGQCLLLLLSFMYRLLLIKAIKTWFTDKRNPPTGGPSIKPKQALACIAPCKIKTAS